MWRTNLSAEEIKDILADLFANFDPRDYWMVIWIERIFELPDGNIVAQTALVRIIEQELTSFKTSKLDFGQLRTIYVPAQLLPIIFPGLIFKGGIIRFKLHYSYMRVEKITINVTGAPSQTLDSWVLGAKFRKKLGFLKNDIPLETGRKSSFGAKSTVHVFPNANSAIDADFIVYPSMELARFYLFTSSRMAQGLIAPKTISKTKHPIFYDPNSLTYPTEEVPSHFLKIRDEMIVRDAFVIARLAFSMEARLAAAEIQRGLLNEGVFGAVRSIFINTFFPFSGETHQDVYGITIVLDNVKIFLVLEISECFHAFPYSSLRFARESDVPEIDHSLPEVKGPPTEYDQGKKEEGNDKDPTRKTEYWFNPTFDNDTTRNNELKNDKKIENAEYVDDKLRFPNLTTDIQQIKFQKTVPPKKDKRGNVVIPTSNLSQNQLTDDDTDSTGLNIVSKEGEVQRCFPGNYIDLLKMIVTSLIRMGCQVRYHNGVDELGQESFHCMSIAVEHLPLDARQQSFAKMSDGKMRRIIAVSVQYKTHHFLILELEPRERTAYKILHKNDFILPFTYSDVAILIDEIVRSEGSMVSLPKTYHYLRFYHEKTSPRTHAARILKRLGIF